jgi:hypothetical protein
MVLAWRAGRARNGRAIAKRRRKGRETGGRVDGNIGVLTVWKGFGEGSEETAKVIVLLQGMGGRRGELNAIATGKGFLDRAKRSGDA